MLEVRIFNRRSQWDRVCDTILHPLLLVLGTVTTEAIQHIGVLNASGPRSSTVRRQSIPPRARLALDAVRAWFVATQARVRGRGDLAAAIRYTLSCWTAFIPYREGDAIQANNA